MTTRTLELPEDVFNELVQYAKTHDLSEAEALRDVLEKVRWEDVPEEDEELDLEEIEAIREGLDEIARGETVSAEEVAARFGLNMDALKSIHQAIFEKR
jgi:predicted transcriptional regulator